MTNIGNLTVTIGADLKSLDKGIKSATGLIQGAFASAIVKGAYELAQMAEEAEDVGHRVDVVFGDMSGSVKSWSKSFAAATSQNALDVQDLAASVGLAASNMGFGADATDDMAMAVVALGSDMAAFLGQEPEQAINAIESAMKSNGKAMKEYGIVIDDAAVEAEALELGLINVGEAMSQQDKAAASLSLIMEKSNKLTGEAVRQSQNLDAQMRGLVGESKELGIVFGKMLIPVFSGFIKTVGLVAKGVEKTINVWQQWGEQGALDDAKEKLARVNKEVERLNEIGEGSGERMNKVLARRAELEDDIIRRSKKIVDLTEDFEHIQEGVNNILGDTSAAFENAKVPADALKNIVKDIIDIGPQIPAELLADRLKDAEENAKGLREQVELIKGGMVDIGFDEGPQIDTELLAQRQGFNQGTSETAAIVNPNAAAEAAAAAATRDRNAAIGTTITAGFGQAFDNSQVLRDLKEHLAGIKASGNASAEAQLEMLSLEHEIKMIEGSQGAQMITGITSGVASVFNPLAGAIIGQLGGPILEAMINQPEVLGDMIKGAIDLVVNAISAIAENLGVILMSILEAIPEIVVDLVKALPRILWDVIKSLGELLAELITFGKADTSLDDTAKYNDQVEKINKLDPDDQLRSFALFAQGSAAVKTLLGIKDKPDSMTDETAVLRWINQNPAEARAIMSDYGYASGTSSAASGLAWVGERGPELVDFGGGEKVYNHADSMAMANGGFNITINLSGSATRSDADMVAAAIVKLQKQQRWSNLVGRA